MNSAENLLTVANEEATELAQALDKVIRFGPQGYHPEHPGETNEFLVMKEYTQLIAVMEMLEDAGIIHSLPLPQWDEIRTAKKDAVIKYSEVSKKIGTLKD